MDYLNDMIEEYKRPVWEMVNFKEGALRGETQKSHPHRLREGWYEKFCPADQNGLDIGCGPDPIHEHFDRWDVELGHGDAMYLDGVPPNKYHTVYTSHLLEHIMFPTMAVTRWFRAVAPGGHLIICVPHRDLFEKQTHLPSRWNPDHKFLWLPDQEEPPFTKSLLKVAQDAISDANIVSLRVLDDGYDPHESHQHPSGEYSIEIILKKA